MILKRFQIVIVFMLIGTGVAHAGEAATVASPRSLGSQFRTFEAEDSLTPNKPDLLDEPSGSLTLAQAQAYALIHSPLIQSFAWEQRVAEARKLQTKAHPNPELGIDVENGPGTGELRGFDNSEQTLQVSQLIELGRKRQKRLSVSSLEVDLTKWDFEAARLDVLTGVAERFYEVLAAQERVALADENDKLAEDVLLTATKRVQTGIASADEEMKARLAVSLAHIERDHAERMLTNARTVLASSWGGKHVLFTNVQNSFNVLMAVPAYDKLVTRIAENPDVARWTTEQAKRQSIMELEKAGKTPDVTLAAGVRHFSAEDDVAMVMGASIPIPLFDTNQGNIRAAHLSVIKGQTEQMLAISEVASALFAAYQNLSSAYNEATQLDSVVLPEALRVFDVAGEKYRQGKSSYLEVLDAQRTVVDVRGRYVDALETYHIARTVVERLIGISLDDVNATQDNN
ncbi:MAG: TolC family protein [bacterium]|nr:TolC family protein [bacterium]